MLPFLSPCPYFLSSFSSSSLLITYIFYPYSSFPYIPTFLFPLFHSSFLFHFLSFPFIPLFLCYLILLFSSLSLLYTFLSSASVVPFHFFILSSSHSFSSLPSLSLISFFSHSFTVISLPPFLHSLLYLSPFYPLPKSSLSLSLTLLHPSLHSFILCYIPSLPSPSSYYILPSIPPCNATYLLFPSLPISSSLK